MNILTNNSKETEDIGKRLASKLKGNEIIAFYGDLGAGKTTFIRGIANFFGMEDMVSSPTFAIVHEYYENDDFKIYHFDMYRINSYEDLESTGFFDYVEKGVILIEWSENIESYLPEGVIKINISKCSEEKRLIDIEGINL